MVGDLIVERKYLLVEEGGVRVLHGEDGTSKGRVPQIMAYRITPQLHRSTCSPLYRFPAIISGAA